MTWSWTPISIHAPLRGRPRRQGQPGVGWAFQSTPPCGGDQTIRDSPQIRVFQSTPPCGGDHQGWDEQRSAGGFQSTPPCGGDTPGEGIGVVESEFQSTPPCGGDQQGTSTEWSWWISIHAPLRGRPPKITPSDRPAPISIHAPLRGRPCLLYDKALHRYFNPRPLAGATSLGQVHHLDVAISIHAPLRGRLVWNLVAVLVYEISIHAPLRGRLLPFHHLRAVPDFNPRPLAGATSPSMFSVYTILNFNPRPLAGATTSPQTKVKVMIFQSTPPCGGDGLLAGLSSYIMISIHAPLRGRPLYQGRPCRLHNFNPRPLAGATRNKKWKVQK